MTDRQLIDTICAAYVAHRDDSRLTGYANQMFRLYTEQGLPPDLVLDKVREDHSFDLLQLVYVVAVYQHAFTRHRAKSGIGSEALDRVRRQNRDEIARVIRVGEVGSY